METNRQKEYDLSLANWIEKRLNKCLPNDINCRDKLKGLAENIRNKWNNLDK